ncbi:hypothetical protein BCR32DRAFT_242346 [Anaeromyces robustus]|jgi:hypothetical protein|uniref:PH domain-containing protein n=1 Tax=Anaeromyces robustus TaxID=1754192 RepID=A0A1Y1XGF2_9FUNG|nr:hypothetical protein BCR32DRAFT_242346 [Anaeromyces robustus]|eukprot:ORX84772.1 hypothetical protein BCR32DRAFT_242346 [Anaeromyces robustus]
MSTNPTPPTILRNLYAKLENMEKELNETTNSPSQKVVDGQKPAPMSPLTLPSNGGNAVDKKQYNVIDKLSKMSINDQHVSNYPASNSSPSTLYQEKGERSRYSADKDEYNSPKMNSIRVAPTPPSINTYYDPNVPPMPHQQRYMQKAMMTEDDTFNLESPYETDIPRYYNGNYVNVNNYPQGYQSPHMYDPRMGSPNGNSFAFSPESGTFYNEMSMPGMDDYIIDYKHQSDYSGKDMYMGQKMGQRQSEYSVGNMTKSSIDINADLEQHARSFAGESESFSETKSFLQQAAEIDMSFDPSILKGKKPKYMKDLVNSNNFHKGGNLTVQTSLFRKKTLFYALTTHRLYAFKEDRSDAELITWYVIDKDARVTRTMYSGGVTFELSTIKGNDKNRETHEFETGSKEERDDWMHSLKKVIQLHKYDEKNLPNLPNDKQGKEVSYTSTLKTPDMKSNTSFSAMSPEIVPPNYYGNANTSFSSSYKSPTSPQYNIKYEPSISSQGSYSNKVSPMYANANQNNGRRGSPQPVMVPGNRIPKHSSPGMNPVQTQMGSPSYYAGNRTPKNLPINQLINNQPSPIQGRQNQPSPRINYYQRSPMQRPQGN